MFHTKDNIGPYTLVKQLGRGAFGVVWLAERRGAIATTQVALKVTLDDNPDIEALRQEAELWVKAGGHPNVLPIIEAELYDGQVVIASEYAPDGALSDWLKKHNNSPTVEGATNMIMGVLAGLKHLHSRRIIHRDLKPANILLQGETPRLADFGVSRVVSTANHSSGVAGTPTYMAPEAFNGDRNEQTDIWSVGVMFYQMLSGKVPFSRPDIPSLCIMIHTVDPPPLPTHIPVSVRKVVLGALEKDPYKRYKSADEMLKALQKSLSTSTIDTLNDSTASTLEKKSSKTMNSGFKQMGQITGQAIGQESLLQATPRNLSTGYKSLGNTIACPSCNQTNGYEPTTNYCVNCSTKVVHRYDPASQGTMYNGPSTHNGAIAPYNMTGQEMVYQNESGQTTVWRALYEGLARHTGSSSLPEIAVKVVFVASLGVYFVINLMEYELWNAIFATCWSAFYAAAFALVGGLLTKIIVMLVEGSQWVKQNKTNKN